MEPRKKVPIPEGPYELLSQDLFQFEGVSYLVTVCHWSDWIECDELPHTFSTTIIKATRKHISHFGRPKYVLTDNESQFVSKEYQRFASEYDFSHITASSYYPRAMGRQSPPENTPPGDAQGWPTCPGEVHAMDKLIVQRDLLNMRRSDRIESHQSI